MTAWTICKGILLAVGILFVGIPLAAGYLWLFVAVRCASSTGSDLQVRVAPARQAAGRGDAADLHGVRLPARRGARSPGARAARAASHR